MQKGRKLVNRAGGKHRSNHARYRAQSKSAYFCNFCGNQLLKRVSAGIWCCRKCNSQFCGNSYTIKLTT